MIEWVKGGCPPVRRKIGSSTRAVGYRVERFEVYGDVGVYILEPHGLKDGKFFRVLPEVPIPAHGYLPPNIASEEIGSVPLKNKII